MRKWFAKNICTTVVYHWRMTRDDPQMKIRLPAELKAQVEQSAAANNRTMNAEIIAQLNATLAVTVLREELETRKRVIDRQQKRIEDLQQQIEKLKAEGPLSYAEAMTKLNDIARFMHQQIREVRAVQHDLLIESYGGKEAFAAAMKTLDADTAHLMTTLESNLKAEKGKALELKAREDAKVALGKQETLEAQSRAAVAASKRPRKLKR